MGQPDAGCSIVRSELGERSVERVLELDRAAPDELLRSAEAAERGGVSVRTCARRLECGLVEGHRRTGIGARERIAAVEQRRYVRLPPGSAHAACALSASASNTACAS